MNVQSTKRAMKNSAIITLALCASLCQASDLGGVASPWTPKLTKMLEDPNELKKLSSNITNGDLTLQCSDDYYIIVSQTQIIHAPIADVAKIVRDFDHYKDWNDGMAVSTGIATTNDRWIFTNETEVPVPFVPNVKTSMHYEITESATKSQFRYQLKESSSLKVYDGFIVLEAINPKTTKFIEFDALNADWGPLKVLGLEGIWKQSIEPMYQSDMALRLMTESPRLTATEAVKKSKKMSDSQSFGDCFKSRKPLESATK